MIKTAITFGGVFSLMILSACSSVPPSQTDYQQALQATAKTCANCAKVSNELMVAHNQECGTPLTPASLSDVIAHEPMYAMLLTAELSGAATYSDFHDAALATIHCEDMQHWTDRTVNRFKQLRGYQD